MLTYLPALTYWTDRVTWTNWSGLEAYLRASPRWKPHQVDSVAAESLRILRKLPEPNRRAQFQARGLVIGYVQSGKTASYTALAARAADAGYRLIIVLSGIHDSLRNQTQVRLNRELVGNGQHWISLTDEDQDFRLPDNPAGFDGFSPVLVVAKKIVPVLERLDRWMEALEGRMDEIPVLLIDDEADQASVNTKENRPIAQLDDPVPSDSNPDETLAPSRTNELIRSILRAAPKAAYVAYTATPFANLLIDPTVFDRVVGDDLFPGDFVLQLPKPDGYTGTEELFGVSSSGRDVVRIVPPAEVRRLKTARRHRSAPIIAIPPDPNLPESLVDAILTFCLVGAIRACRGQSGDPHTMLVHVSQRKEDQERVGGLITDLILSWQSRERVSPGSTKRYMNQAWQTLRGGVRPVDIAEDALIDQAIVVMGRLDVAVLNSDTGEELAYDTRVDRHLIAVGGNRLSRGLTLEGLTISYFIRTAMAADTMLQMARWYGFRADYDDLIRIWTTSDIAECFTELALVEESMRRSITAMEIAGRRPDEMQVRLRAHSRLLLTSRNKSRMAEEVDASYSLEHPQTTSLPLEDDSALCHNWALTDRFIGGLAFSEQTSGGMIAFDVPAKSVVDFLRQYRSHDEAIAFRSGPIADWIAGRVAADELVTWTVFVASPENSSTVTVGNRQIGLTLRSPIGPESIGILISPAHEGIDMPGGPSAYIRDTGSYDTDAIRRSRSPTRGLLIVYLLDPDPLEVISVEAVVALALSLPQTSDAGTAYIVNRGIAGG